MTSLVAAAREAVGDEIDISIDCHSLFSVHAAMKLAECLGAVQFDVFGGPCAER